MDRTKIYELMGIPALGILLTGVEILSWGRELVLECLYAPLDHSKPFKIVFEGCEEIHWEVYGEDSADTTADVIGIDIGADRYAEPAVINTDIFEVTVLYNELTILKDWDSI